MPTVSGPPEVMRMNTSTDTRIRTADTAAAPMTANGT